KRRQDAAAARGLPADRRRAQHCTSIKETRAIRAALRAGTAREASRRDGPPPQRLVPQSRDAKAKLQSRLRYHFHRAAGLKRHRPSMNLQFLQDNWPLLMVMIASGAIWLWLTLRPRFSSVREIGALEATQLINRRDALMLDLREPKEYEGGRVPNAVHLPGSQ